MIECWFWTVVLVYVLVFGYVFRKDYRAHIRAGEERRASRKKALWTAFTWPRLLIAKLRG